MTLHLRRTALVVSPTPPLPRDYGNRNRVHQTTEFLRAMGFDISFVLYPFDSDWEKSVPPYYRQLVASFDYFAVVPNSRPLHVKAEGEHHRIDEWWDETLEREIRWLSQRKPFDVMLVNYAFFSRAFDLAPKNCLKILDTHDLFTGRREMFARYGVEPEFFYTDADEEKIAFDRADAVIAIKDSEAKQIRKASKSFVVSLPYWDSFAEPAERVPPPPEFTHERPLRLGFIGAQNSVNSVNMNRFLQRFDRYVRLYDLPVEMLVAGNVGLQIRGDFPFVKKLGRIAEIADFYSAVDAVVAPLEFSTGIKIKVAEAMAWGAPVVATANAFDGFRPFHKLQAEPSVAALCESLAALALNEISLTDLAEAGRNSASAAARAQERAFAELRKWIKQKTRRNVVATMRPFWRRDTFADEQIAQATELLSQVARTVVLVAGEEQPKADRLYTEVDFVAAPAEDWPSLCGEMSRFGHIAALLLCEGAPALGNAEAEAKQVWRLDVRAGLARPGAEPSPPSSLLRYTPLGAVAATDPSRVAIVTREDASEWETAVADWVAALCEERQMKSSRISAGEDGLSAPEFHAAVICEPASRWLLIGQGDWARVLQQVAAYRGAACLIAREDLLAPRAFDQDGRASLTQSLSAFLDDDIRAGLISGANTGWSDVWA